MIERIENFELLNFEDVILSVCNSDSSIGCYQFNGDKDYYIQCCNCPYKEEHSFCRDKEFILSEQDLNYLKELCSKKCCDFLNLIFITCKITATSDFWNNCQFIKNIPIDENTRYCTITYFDLLMNMENKYHQLLDKVPYLTQLAKAYYTGKRE